VLEARQRRHVREHVHFLLWHALCRVRVRQQLAREAVLQARWVKPLEAGDVEEQLGFDASEHLLLQHPPLPKMSAPAAGGSVLCMAWVVVFVCALQFARF